MRDDGGLLCEGGHIEPHQENPGGDRDGGESAALHLVPIREVATGAHIAAIRVKLHNRRER